MSLAASASRTPSPSDSHDVTVRLGTRGSALALTQTRSVATMLTRRYPEGAFPIVTIRTEGDRDKTSPLSVIGGCGVFTSALEAALLANEIDAAVHSAKDLPSVVPPDLVIAAFPAREDPRDVLVSKHGLPLEHLPSDPVIGTSSRRRAFQVLRLRPDARIVELRGNLDTRLRKAIEGDLDGVILAAAGIARMGWSERVTHYLPVDRFVPAPGQGALALETRVAPDPMSGYIATLNDPHLALAVSTEREFLRGVGAGCTSPVGAFADVTPDGTEVSITAIIASDDGARWEQVQERYPAADAGTLALALGRRLLAAVSRKSATPGFRRSSLTGRRVLVTSAGATADRLGAALRDAGAEPLALPLIRIVPTARPQELRTAVDRLASGFYAWLVVTSGNAVDALVEAMGETAPNARSMDVRVAAIGHVTAQRLREAGFRLDLVPDVQTANGLVDAFGAMDIAGLRMLCPLGDLARPALVDGLRQKGATVEMVEAYRTAPVNDLPDDVLSALKSGQIDAITFASPSAVQGFVELVARLDLPFPEALVACIGPATSAAADAAGLPVAVVAAKPSAAALADAIAAHLTVANGGTA